MQAISSSFPKKKPISTALPVNGASLFDAWPGASGMQTPSVKK